MVVADSVLVDVVHGEAVGLTVVLSVVGPLHGAVTGGLNYGEGDELLLEGDIFSVNMLRYIIYAECLKRQGHRHFLR